MTSKEIRNKFFEFFKSKEHKIVPSAPIVVKDDPTLMFTNAGMNQFKDYFLGDKTPEVTRVADTQKCLRVSGKHNDLEEVGRDSYHHTMFEMLGNWSFGDYFKAEAIDWAWELLTEVYGLEKDRLYVTVFEGDASDNLGPDAEAFGFWKRHLPEERILYAGKKDNFWEMGDTGPCGPCSEIHIDLRPDAERDQVDGATLVNQDNPLVVEIWNLVFIQFNRKSDGTLKDLPAKHVDTGMGFERLCMAMQGKQSNYATDVFQPLIQYIEKETGVKYTGSYEPTAKRDIAMRVMVDHLRAVSFTIADGEMPSNTGAGYVIRRILRRAVRYYYSFLDVKEPFLYKMVDSLADSFSDVFPELDAQRAFVSKVIQEEEKSFLRTLEGGLKRLENISIEHNVLDGKTAFELYDTYGFPIDLTMLIGSEAGWTVDEAGFRDALKEQKERSRADAKRETGDWHQVGQEAETQFIGYDEDSLKAAHVVKYRVLKKKDKEVYQLVLDRTPFYAEGGGQVGDKGQLVFQSGEKVQVVDTVKENDLIIHVVDKLPEDMTGEVEGAIDVERRRLIENNHSATHLLHAALRQVLGTHVQQKGSLVKDSYLRFDFSHFQKVTDAEIAEIERIVNRKIRENIHLDEHRNIAIQAAKDAGAMMLFGEKYGDYVRMITFDPAYSRELCGGCHVDYTGRIGLFKITGESAIAAGVRRIEAVTADAAEAYINSEIATLNAVKEQFKNAQDVVKSVADIQQENAELKKEIEQLMAAQASGMKEELLREAEEIQGVKVVRKVIEGLDQASAKNLAYALLNETDAGVVLFGLIQNDKPQLLLAIDKEYTASKGWNAGGIIRTLAKEIRGGGGGQPFFATAGGSDASGLAKAIDRIDTLL